MLLVSAAQRVTAAAPSARCWTTGAATWRSWQRTPRPATSASSPTWATACGGRGGQCSQRMSATLSPQAAWRPTRPPPACACWAQTTSSIRAPSRRRWQSCEPLRLRARRRWATPSSPSCPCSRSSWCWQACWRRPGGRRMRSSAAPRCSESSRRGEEGSGGLPPGRWRGGRQQPGRWRRGSRCTFRQWEAEGALQGEGPAAQ